MIQYKGLQPLESGQKILARGVMTKPETSRIPGAFDYAKHLSGRNIRLIFKAETIEIVEEGFHPFRLGEMIASHFDGYSPESSKYLKAFILGQTNEMDEQDKSDITKLGIGHLFAVSGLHIHTLVFCLRLVMKKVKIKETFADGIVMIVLGLYMVASRLLLSVIRAGLMEMFAIGNQRLNLGLDGLDRFSLIFCGFLIFFPNVLYQTSFVLSFSVTLFLILGANLTREFKTFWGQGFMISALASFASFPMVVRMNGEFNPWTILLNVFYVGLVGFVLLPFTFLTAIFKPLDFFYAPVIVLYESMTRLSASMFHLPIRFGEPTMLLLILYVVVCLFFLRSLETKKHIMHSGAVLILFFVVYSNASWMRVTDEIHFLDLLVGESTVIIEKLDRCNIVIDTGEGKRTEVGDFLKRKGIKRIDYLIITHGDSDHIGEATSLMNAFFVKNVIIGGFDETKLTNEMISNNIRSNVLRMRSGDEIECGSIHFQVLSPIFDLNNSNENSLVLMGEVFGERILFTGDLGSKGEQLLVQTYGTLKFDTLKVGHHGSATSTSDTFLEHLHFSRCVIMAGNKNPFGFPREVVVEKLKDWKVYRTDLNHTITYKRFLWERDLTISTWNR